MIPPRVGTPSASGLTLSSERVTQICVVSAFEVHRLHDPLDLGPDRLGRCVVRQGGNHQANAIDIDDPGVVGSGPTSITEGALRVAGFERDRAASHAVEPPVVRAVL